MKQRSFFLLSAFVMLLAAILACNTPSSGGSDGAQLTIQALSAQLTIQAQGAQLTSLASTLAAPTQTSVAPPPTVEQPAQPPPTAEQPTQPPAILEPMIHADSPAECWSMATNDPNTSKSVLDTLPAGYETPIIATFYLRKDETKPWTLTWVLVKSPNGCQCWVFTNEITIVGDPSGIQSNRENVFLGLFSSCP